MGQSHSNDLPSKKTDEGEAHEQNCMPTRKKTNLPPKMAVVVEVPSLPEDPEIAKVSGEKTKLCD